MTGSEILDRGYFRKALVDLLTNCKTDKQYYKRLLWAQELITECLQDFQDDFNDTDDGLE